MLAVILFLPHLSLASSSPGESPPPNLVMIVADDLGWGDAPWHDPHIQAPRHDSFFGILFICTLFGILELMSNILKYEDHCQLT